MLTSRRPRRHALLSAAVVLLMTSWLIGPALPAAAATTASDPAAPMGSAPLPTTQINGVVWNQAVVGTTVIAGGKFTKARPAGAAAGVGEVTRNNLLAYNLTTGALISSFNPDVNGEVKNVLVAPDAKTIYIVGTFTKVGTATRNRIAALDLTGKLLPFAPDLNGPAYGVQVRGSTVYVVGGFNTANGVSRIRAAAFTTAGVLTRWAPAVSGGDVRQLAIAPDGTRIVLGGNFTGVDGSSKGFGLAMVGTETGTKLYPMAINDIVRNGSSAKSGIYDIAADSSGFYGTGWGNSPTLEGAFKADWKGNLVYLEDCHGDTYSVYPTSSTLYTASHAHYCANTGSFTQTDPQSHSYAMAWSNSVQGRLSTDPTHYTSWAGRPRPSALSFYPDFTAGTFTGQDQATWDVTGSGNYVLYGGEFLTVDGVPQQGLVRFLAKSAQRSTDAPVKPSGWRPRVTDLADGRARISWPAIRDRDDSSLSYQLIKNGDVAHPIYTTTATAHFWALPVLGTLEDGLVTGAKATYQVRAVDPEGNTTLSDVAATTYSPGQQVDDYGRTVLAANPEYDWTAGQADPPAAPTASVSPSAAPTATTSPTATSPTTSTSPAVASDLAGSGKPTVDSSVRSETPGALGADSSAFVFNGSAKLVSPTAEQAPNTFSLGTWFKTTSTHGGALIDMGNTRTGDSATYNPTFADPGNPDRTIFLGPNGTVNFGVWARGPHTVSTTAAYNDGRWHQAVATMDLSGMKLYVDGKLVGTSAGTYAGINIKGYWRVGGDKLTGWPNNPSTGYYSGAIDQVAIYQTALTAGQVASQYAAR